MANIKNSPPLLAEPLPTGFGGTLSAWVVVPVRTRTSCLEGELMTVAVISIGFAWSTRFQRLILEHLKRWVLGYGCGIV
jgi:hypothetical protein